MPSQNSVHYDKLLTNVSVAYLQNPNSFVAGRVFPVVPVSKQSDLYLYLDSAAFNRDEMKVRADSSESAGGNFTYSDDNYFCKVYAFHHDIGDQTMANADDPFQLKRSASEYVSMKGLIKKEKQFAANYFTTGVWTTDLIGVNAATVTSGEFLTWSDSASTPIEDIQAAATAQQLLTGFRPNILVIGRTVADALKLHPDVIDRVKYGTQTNISIASLPQIATLLEVEEIIVMEAIENTAPEGLTPVNAFIGGSHALLTYRTRSPGLMTPTAGYNFAWTGLNGGFGGMGATVDSWYMKNIKSTRVEIEMAFDMKVVSPDMGTFFEDAAGSTTAPV